MGFAKNMSASGLLGNPMFQAGMGLLSSNYTGADPYASLTRGLLSAQQFKQYQAEQEELRKQREEAEAERQRKAELEKMIAERVQQQKVMMQQPSMMPGPLPMPNMPQMQNAAAGGMAGAIDDALMQLGTPVERNASLSRAARRREFREKIALEDRRIADERAYREEQRRRNASSPQGGLTSVYDPVSGKQKMVFLTEGGQIKDTGLEPEAKRDIVKGPNGRLFHASTGQPLTPAEEDHYYRQGAAHATAYGKSIGTDSADAINSLRSSLNASNQTFNTLNRMESHPGRQMASGVSGLLNPVTKLGRGDTADYLALRKQATGSAFLEAFQSLKGGGHITEIEGQKATEAITRLGQGLSEAEELKAIRELKFITLQGMRRAQEKAGAPLTPIPQDLLDEFATPGINGGPSGLEDIWDQY